MKTIHLYIGVLALLLSMTLTAQAAPEARFGKLSKTYTLHADGSQELRVQKELTLYTHAAMNSLYGETFIVYDPQYQQLEIHDSYTRQKDGTIVRTPDNAFVDTVDPNPCDSYVADILELQKVGGRILLGEGQPESLVVAGRS